MNERALTDLGVDPATLTAEDVMERLDARVEQLVRDLQARPDESVITQVAVAGPGGLGPARRGPALAGQSTSDLLPPGGSGSDAPRR